MPQPNDQAFSASSAPAETEAIDWRADEATAKPPLHRFHPWSRRVRRLWFALAGLIIIIAVIVNVLRIMTPLLAKYRLQFQALASEVLHHPVSITSMSANWNGIEPTLKLADVTIYSNNRAKQLLHLNYVKVGVDVWDSLLHRKPVLGNLTISGAKLTVHQPLNKPLAVDGLSLAALNGKAIGSSATSSSDSKPTSSISSWLLQHDRISLRDINIRWYLPNGHLLPLHNLAFTLVNNEDQHYLRGDGTLAQTVPTKFHFVVNLTGDIAAWNKLHGKLYLNSDRIILAQWLPKVLMHNISIKHGLAKIEAWIKWHGTKLDSVQGNLGISELALHDIKTDWQQFIPYFGLHYAWQQTKHGWQVAADKINLTYAGLDYPLESFIYTQGLDSNKQLQHKLQLKYLPLAATWQWLSEHPGLQQAIPALKNVRNYKLSGQLYDISASAVGPISNPTSWQINTKLDDVAINNQQNGVKINNLTGEVHADPQQGKIYLTGKNIHLADEKVFAHDISLQKLSSTVHWQRHQNSPGLKIYSDAINITDPALKFHGSFSLDIPADIKQAMLKVAASYKLANAKLALTKLPDLILKPRLRKWLHMAVEDGSIAGNAVVNGKLKDFPFANGKGKFAIISKLHDLDLKFADDWPAAHKLNGTLKFINQGMYATVANARLVDLPLHNVTVNINNLSTEPSVLEINGQVNETSKLAIGVLRQSVLVKKLPILNNIDVSGPMQTKINIVIPLDKRKHDSKIKGSTIFTNADVLLPKWNLAVHNIAGTLHFTQAGIKINNMHGNLWQHAINFDLQNIKDSKKRDNLLVTVRGTVATKTLVAKDYLPQNKFITGATKYTALLRVPDSGKGDTTLKVLTNLQGVKVNLPKPLDKAAAEKRHAVVKLIFNDNSKATPELHIAYANNYHAALGFIESHGKKQINRLGIHFGTADAKLPSNSDVQFSGTLDNLDVATWKQFLRRQQAKKATNNSQATAEYDSLLKHIRGNVFIKKLKIFKQKFTDLQTNFSWQQPNFVAELKGPQVFGSIIIDNNHRQAISADLKRLYLAKSPKPKSNVKKPTKSKLYPKDMPDLNLNIADFHYGKGDFGSLQLNAIANNRTVQIKSFKISSPYLKLDTVGNWQLSNDNQQQTDLEGYISSNKLAGLLQQFALKPVLSSKQSLVKFKLHWPGAPVDFALKNSSGQGSFEFKDGWLTHMDKATEEKIGLGKLFSVLSLDMLPKRLLLDFSDLSHKGLSFDNWNGNFLLNKGVISTGNTVLDGPVAYIGMNGEIGLAKELYNMTLHVTPHIGASLPVIATIAGGPIAGAVTFVANKLISAEMQKSGAYVYRLTGNWKHPLVKRIH